MRRRALAVSPRGENGISRERFWPSRTGLRHGWHGGGYGGGESWRVAKNGGLSRRNENLIARIFQKHMVPAVAATSARKYNIYTYTTVSATAILHLLCLPLFSTVSTTTVLPFRPPPLTIAELYRFLIDGRRCDIEALQYINILKTLGIF